MNIDCLGTALVYATEQNDPGMVKILLDNSNTDVNAKKPTMPRNRDLCWKQTVEQFKNTASGQLAWKGYYSAAGW